MRLACRFAGQSERSQPLHIMHCESEHGVTAMRHWQAQTAVRYLAKPRVARQGTSCCIAETVEIAKAQEATSNTVMHSYFMTDAMLWFCVTSLKSNSQNNDSTHPLVRSSYTDMSGTKAIYACRNMAPLHLADRG